MKTLPKTLADAYADGYQDADVRRTRGYVSRRNFNRAVAAIYAGQGYRKDYIFYLAPCFDSSQYCFRVYLEKGEA